MLSPGTLRVGVAEDGLSPGILDGGTPGVMAGTRWKVREGKGPQHWGAALGGLSGARPVPGYAWCGPWGDGETARTRWETSA